VNTYNVHTTAGGSGTTTGPARRPSLVDPLEQGGCGRDDQAEVALVAPRADPDVQNSRIRLLGRWIR